MLAAMELMKSAERSRPKRAVGTTCKCNPRHRSNVLFKEPKSSAKLVFVLSTSNPTRWTTETHEV
jgi:hypothetical protein